MYARYLLDTSLLRRVRAKEEVTGRRMLMYMKGCASSEDITRDLSQSFDISASIDTGDGRVAERREMLGVVVGLLRIVPV